MLFYKYTLTENEIVIKKVFSKERIPYSKFTDMINEFPPFQYRGHMIFMTEGKMIKFEYSGTIGGINFLQYFYDKIGYVMTEEELLYLVKKVKDVYVRGATKEEKKKYKEYKAYLKKNAS